MVNHGMEPVKSRWKPRTFNALQVPDGMKELLGNMQPIPVALQEKIQPLLSRLAAVRSRPENYAARRKARFPGWLLVSGLAF
jgi:hypothetical protein